MICVHSSPLATLGGKETGGMNVYVRELSRVLALRGLQIDIFTRSQNEHSPKIRLWQDGVRIIYIKAGQEKPFHKDLIWKHLPEFLRSVQQFCIVNKVTYDLIHSHYWLSGWVGRKLARQNALPLLHMYHTLASLKNAATDSLGISESPTRLRVEKQLVKSTDHILVSSAREKEMITACYGVPSEKITLLPCGVDTDLFQPRSLMQSHASISIPSKKFILYVGRIDPIKGIDVLIKAMRLVKAALGKRNLPHLLIIGGDLTHAAQSRHSELNKLKGLAKSLQLDDTVTFLGAQPQDLLPYYYSAAEACVLPSRYESFGMVALEAMACGTPVIVTTAGGISSLIQDGETGFLIPEEDETALAQAILRLGDNKFLKKHLSTKARTRAMEFTWSNIAKQVHSLYDSLIPPLPLTISAKNQLLQKSM
jgi:D-inositol-3-phosphate glycosyltransferase